MKVRGKLILAAAILLTVLLLCAGITKNPTEKQIKKDALQDVSEALSVDVTDGTVLHTEDSHGGFLGDGLTFTQIQFGTKDCLQAIAESPDWKPLPLPAELSLLLYGGEMGDRCERAPLESDAKKAPCMQKKIENGYYYFLDRYMQNYPNEADTPLFARFSWNFTLALYDADTDILYYIKFDT